MTARVIIGQRDSLYGVWVSPPGVDAGTAGIDDLSFFMGADYVQIALLGEAAANEVIPFNFAAPPHVLMVGRQSTFISRPLPSPAGYPFAPGIKGANARAIVTATQCTLTIADSYIIFKRTF